MTQEHEDGAVVAFGAARGGRPRLLFAEACGTALGVLGVAISRRSERWLAAMLRDLLATLGVA